MSRLSHYPGLAGQAVRDLAMESVSMPYEGGSCGLLVDQLRTDMDPTSRVVAANLDGQPALSFSMTHVFIPMSDVPFQITVSSGTPVRVLRVTSGSHVLSLGYPATIAPISASRDADVIPAEQVPAARLRSARPVRECRQPIPPTAPRSKTVPNDGWHPAIALVAATAQVITLASRAGT